MEHSAFNQTTGSNHSRLKSTEKSHRKKIELVICCWVWIARDSRDLGTPNISIIIINTYCEYMK